jgi:hypothetical protein
VPASYSKKREPLRPSKTWGSLVAALQRKPSLDILSGESHLHRQPGTSKDRSMPTHRKRPRDFSQAAKLVIDIATGQVEDRPPTPEERGKDPAAAALGAKGGRARAEGMSAKRRRQIVRKAAQARWKD